ncbi:MAG: hypothetical protein CM1200mP18_18210 [Gammaproteobacteria bacterium]|nr:MAG: hypothetical protein CM1200mP18_18210 [Gammaproteobacteria bacterium]
MCMTDRCCFLRFFGGAIKIGAIPVPVNTMLRILITLNVGRSCARILVVSESLYPKFATQLDSRSSLDGVFIDGPDRWPPQSV